MKKAKLILKFINLVVDAGLLIVALIVVQASINLNFSFLYLGLTILILFFFKVYSTKIRPLFGEIKAIFLALFFTLPLVFIANYLIFFQVSAPSLVYRLFILSLLFLILGHLIFAIIIILMSKLGTLQTRVLIFGFSRSAERLIKDFQRQRAIKIVGIVDNVISKGMRISGIPVLGKFNTVLKIIEGEKIDQVFQASNLEQTTNLLTICQKYQIELKILPNILGIYRDKIASEEIQGVSLIRVVGTPLSGWGHIYKRVFDLVFSSILLIVFSPLIFFIWFVLKISQPQNPAIIVEQRFNGFTDKELAMFRFRGGLRLKNQVSKNYQKNTLVLNRLKDKDKNYFKRTFLLELPQLFNVFWGDLSLIGPRPPYLIESKNYQDIYKKRFLVKPGMISLAMVEGQDKSFSEIFEADRKYIEEWSPFLDFKIFILGVWFFLKRILAL